MHGRWSSLATSAKETLQRAIAKLAVCEPNSLAQAQMTKMVAHLQGQLHMYLQEGAEAGAQTAQWKAGMDRRSVQTSNTGTDGESPSDDLCTHPAPPAVGRAPLSHHFTGVGGTHIRSSSPAADEGRDSLSPITTRESVAPMSAHRHNLQSHRR